MRSNRNRNLPRGFLLRPGEVALFASRAQCHLPTTQTKTYGFGGGFIGAESDAHTVTENRGYGEVVITSERMVVQCRSDVREWPIHTIISANARRTVMGSHLEITIANHGAARFFWAGREPVAQRAENAIKQALSEFHVIR